MSEAADQFKRVLVPNPLRWAWRNPFKCVAVIACLLVAGWHFENWRGKRELVKQRELWVAEFGEVSVGMLSPDPIPSDQNFFAAPVFEAMASGGEIDGLPNSKFLKLSIPSIASLPTSIGRAASTHPGFETLDLDTAARAHAKAGVTQPEGLSVAQWLHREIPSDKTIDGLRAALHRPGTMQIPTTGECWRYGIENGNPSMIPIPMIGSITPLSNELSTRARVAAQAGDARRGQRR